jgi:hypothetical protein
MRLGGFLALALAAATTIVHADIYTWTDEKGRVQYADHPPKNFKGDVKRIPVDEQPAPAAPYVAPTPKAQPRQEPGAAQPTDMAGKRRAQRERLAAGLHSAQEKLAAARKALEENREPGVDERQIVQRPGADPKALPMPGFVPPASRSNCRVIERDGRKSTMCAVSMPSEAYYDRITQLEGAVKAAEEDLAVAERAYRRGVD